MSKLLGQRKTIASIVAVKLSGAAAQFVVPVAALLLFDAKTSAALLATSAILNLAAIMGVAGFGVAATKYVPVLRPSQLRDFESLAYRRWLATSAALAVVMFTVGMLLVATTNMPVGMGLTFAAVALLPRTLMRLHEGMLRGASLPTHAILSDSVVTPMLAIAMVFAASAVSDRSEFALGAYVAAVYGGAAVSTLLWRRERRTLTVVVDANPTFAGDWQHTAWYGLWSGSGSMVMRNADIVVLSVLSDAANVTVYGLASRSVLLADLGLYAANIAYSHRIAAAYAAQCADSVRSNFLAARRVSRVGAVGVLSALVLVVLAFGSSVSVGSLPEVEDPLIVLGLVALAAFASGWAGPVVSTANMVSREKTAATITVYAAVANVTLNILLVPSMGAVGAAASSFVVVATLNVALSRVVGSVIARDEPRASEGSRGVNPGRAV